MQLRYFPSNSSITDMSISLAGVALHVKTNTLLAPLALASQKTVLPPPVYLSGALCPCHRSRLGLAGAPQFSFSQPRCADISATSGTRPPALTG